MNSILLQCLKFNKKKKHYTNEELARLSCVPLGTVNKIFSGDTDDPKLSTVAAICRTLEISLDDAVNEIFPEENARYLRLDNEEAELISLWRSLDTHGKHLLLTVANCETARIKESDTASLQSRPRSFRSLTAQQKTRLGLRMMPLFDLPVSAGTGVFLTDTESTEITVPVTAASRQADFALRVSGDSMEPKYHDSDILFVRQESVIERGQLGIFNVGGEAFFKLFGGDRLISLNKQYADIVLTETERAECIGIVTGKIKKENVIFS